MFIGSMASATGSNWGNVSMARSLVSNKMAVGLLAAIILNPYQESLANLVGADLNNPMTALAYSIHSPDEALT